MHSGLYLMISLLRDLIPPPPARPPRLLYSINPICCLASQTLVIFLHSGDDQVLHLSRVACCVGALLGSNLMYVTFGELIDYSHWFCILVCICIFYLQACIYRAICAVHIAGLVGARMQGSAASSSYYSWGLLNPECLLMQLQKIITTQQPYKKKK